MFSSGRVPFPFNQMSEEELDDMLLDDYDPSAGPCALLLPVTTGAFAQELAELGMNKGGANIGE